MKQNNNILVIEDDSNTLEILEMILEGAGYTVDIARDHHLEFLETKVYPDLILLDNNLGMKNGSEICKELKANKETMHIPVILISAMDGIKQIAKDASADDFIAKPFGIQLMLEKIQGLLEKQLPRT